ncbi:hypothetical protein [Salinicola tamaricis]|nr:hypothetical protein [Salinicola tamaricis]
MQPCLAVVPRHLLYLALGVVELLIESSGSSHWKPDMAHASWH